MKCCLKNNDSAIARFKHWTYESQDLLIQLRSTGTKRCGWPNMPHILRVEIGCITQKLVPTSLCVPTTLVWVKHRCQVVKEL